MSKHETWRTRKFWNRTGGLLIEEFVAVKQSKQNGGRFIDGVIVLGEPKSIHKENNYNISGRDIISIQTKSDRVGMYVMGQAFFTRELLKAHKPKSIRTVIICGQDDSVLRPICDKHNMELVIIPESEK